MPEIIHRCCCGRTYDATAWSALEPVGNMPDGEGGLLSLRNCACGSTRAIVLSEPTPEPLIDACARCGVTDVVTALGDEPACSLCAALASGSFDTAVAA